MIRVLFEIVLMIVQFLNLCWMGQFFPSNVVEWLINFMVFIYVFAEFHPFRRKRK